MSKRTKSVIATSLSTGEQKYYDSMSKASKDLCINLGHISLCCNRKGGNKTAKSKRSNEQYIFDFGSEANRLNSDAQNPTISTPIIDDKSLGIDDKSLGIDEKPLSIDEKQPLSIVQEHPIIDEKPLSLDKEHSIIDEKPLGIDDKPLDESPLSLDEKPLSIDKDSPIKDKKLERAERLMYIQSIPNPEELLEKLKHPEILARIPSSKVDFILRAKSLEDFVNIKNPEKLFESVVSYKIKGNHKECLEEGCYDCLKQECKERDFLYPNEIVGGGLIDKETTYLC